MVTLRTLSKYGTHRIETFVENGLDTSDDTMDAQYGRVILNSMAKRSDRYVIVTENGDYVLSCDQADEDAKYQLMQELVCAFKSINSMG